MFYSREIRRNILSAVLVIFVLVTLFLGLSFKGHDFQNKIITAKDHLHFVDRSLGVIDLGLSKSELDLLSRFGFSISMEIELTAFNKLNTRHLLTIISGSENDINFFFWKNQLIINIGNDYNYKKRLPRVTVNLKEGKYLLDVFFTQDSISLYADNKKIKEVKVKKEYLAFSPDGVKMLFGGHLLTKKSWHGKMYMFSMSMLPKKIQPSLLGSIEPDPLNLFLFDNLQNNFYEESVGGNMFVLPKYPVLEHRVLLRKTSFSDIPSISTIIDIIVNLGWFMLLSSLFYLYLMNYNLDLKFGFVCSFFMILLFSFTIEYLQSWLPMRDSSLRDFVLNTSGGFLGCIAMYLTCFNKRVKEKLLLL